MALFRPTYMKNRLTDLSAAQLQTLGIHTLLLDVDNTLSTHHSQTPLEGIEGFLQEMKQAGIRMMIVSNARRARVAPFAEKLGLDYFWLCKKPLPFRLNRAVRQMGVDKRGVLLCGDQLFTDMPAGNLAGVRTLLVTPAKPEDGWTFRLRRKWEAPLLRKYAKEHTR